MTKNQKFTLVKRPVGMPDETHLKLEESAIPRAGEDEVLLQTRYLSLDPYMRGRMNDSASYATPVGLGEVMTGEAVSEVLESRHPDLSPGDMVIARTGWQTHSVARADALYRIDPGLAPPSAWLGVMGMTGFTAYVGLLEFGRPKPGETVVVSAASGAVGQVVGQIAKMKGCRVVGVAGANDKCQHVVDHYGFDACVNYKDDNFEDQLEKACPNGIDVYFENVGGKVFEAVMKLVNPFARIPVCGRIAHYNQTELPEGPDRLVPFMGQILIKRLMFRGFIQSDHHELLPQFRRDMSQWLEEGKVRYQEDVVEGFENALSAFQGLLQGRNRGKLVIKVS
ncbi:NADP-dependent oxidoreductase [Marinobacter piscensis]|uniref:NADP-dependent oxidoreductase n=1 Tax=Marinobacter piscensis TaxID=1562308 RepID=UPI0011A33AC1|nr:NADP-dependent oxidoreductase [Marinobacter piscensis]